VLLSIKSSKNIVIFATDTVIIEVIEVEFYECPTWVELPYSMQYPTINLVVDKGDTVFGNINIA
jgi:hypothetical protein